MIKATYTTLGDKLRTMRKNSGKTQKKLASQLNISVRTLQDYEHNVSDIPTKKMIAACIYCNCDIINLLSDFMPARLLKGKTDSELESDKTKARVKK